MRRCKPYPVWAMPVSEVGPFLIGWLKETTGSFTGGLLASGVGVLLTGILTMALGRERYARKK